MTTLELQYLQELKKNIKLKRQIDILRNTKNNGKEDILNTKFNKQFEYIKKNIEVWSEGNSNKEIYTALTNIVKIDPVIQGAGIAFEPNIYKGDSGKVYYEDYRLFAPFIFQFRNKKDYVKYDIADNDYIEDSDSKWWEIPRKTLEPYLTEPFLGKLSHTNVINKVYPIIVKNKFYGVLLYVIAWEDLNFICGFI